MAKPRLLQKKAKSDFPEGFGPNDYSWFDMPAETGSESEIEKALRGMITWAAGNGSSKNGNPYTKPEIHAALRALWNAHPKKNPSAPGAQNMSSPQRFKGSTAKLLKRKADRTIDTAIPNQTPSGAYRHDPFMKTQPIAEDPKKPIPAWVTGSTKLLKKKR